MTFESADNPIPFPTNNPAWQGRDRRRHNRLPVARPCKVFRPMTRRYAAACTKDISEGGALIEIESARPLMVGEWLGVGVAWTDTPVLSEQALLEALVVRVEPMPGDRQCVAVRFNRACELVAAA